MPKGDKEILKADPEDGTTPISNLLLEAVAMAHLSGEEKGAVLFLWRRTYGWVNGDKRKTEDEISLPEWAAALDSSKDYVARVVKRLVQKQIIIQKDLGKGKGYIYSMNTRVNQWDGSSLNSLLLSERYSQGLSKKYTPLPTKRTTPPATNLAMPKETLKKVKKKDNNNDLTLIFKFIKENIKQSITTHIQQRITEFSQLFSPEQILEAFKLAHENNKTAGYAFGILKDWQERWYKAPKPSPARQGKKPIPKLWPNSECKASLSGFFTSRKEGVRQ